MKGTLALAHNGNLINANELRHDLEYTGAIFQTTIDSEVIAYHVAREASEKVGTVEEAVRRGRCKNERCVFHRCREPAKTDPAPAIRMGSSHYVSVNATTLPLLHPRPVPTRDDRLRRVRT
ncbi:MAG: hypothetical protein ACLUD0_14570 [Eubacterium ramulus]